MISASDAGALFYATIDVSMEILKIEKSWSLTNEKLVIWLEAEVKHQPSVIAILIALAFLLIARVSNQALKNSTPDLRVITKC